MDESVEAMRAREQRNLLLVGTDWKAFPDNPRCTPELIAYRQALRDLPSQDGFPYNICWPIAPE